MLLSLLLACKMLQPTQLVHSVILALISKDICTLMIDCWAGKKADAKSELCSQRRPEVAGKEVRQTMVQCNRVEWENLLLKVVFW